MQSFQAPRTSRGRRDRRATCCTVGDPLAPQRPGVALPASARGRRAPADGRYRAGHNGHGQRHRKHAAGTNAVTGTGDHAAELAVLWPALAAALARDTAGDGTVPGGALGSAAVVNADVLAAMITLTRDVPAVTRAACEALGEPWQPRPVQTCLRALPRLAERLGHLGMAVEWVTSGQIYCPARACGASWPQGQWRLLGRMLGAAAVA